MSKETENQKSLARASLRQERHFSLSIRKLASRFVLPYPNKEMFKRIITALTLLIAFANVTFAAGVACEISSSDGMTICAADDISPSNPAVAAQCPQDDNDEDVQHHAHPGAHHCHFGHCGVITTYLKFSPFVMHSQCGFSTQSLVLDSFIANLFRPPIA